MAIDHVVGLDCAPKRALGAAGIVERIKSRARAESVLRIARDNGDARSPEAITFKIGVVGPKGMLEEREASVGTLLQHSAPLEAHRATCASCPANRGAANGFGCYDSINYPIKADAEAWLLDRLPPSFSSTAGFLFAKALVDFGYDGAQAQKMREVPGRFFESPDQLGRRYEAEDVVIGSNMLFHMLFHVGPLGAHHARLMCLFFGVLPHDLEPARLGAPDVMATARPIPRQDGQAEQLAVFLRACEAAARLDVELFVDG